MAERKVTYWDYIRVEDLLRLQSGVEGDESQLSGDEVLFITVHQVDELWFKLALRDLVAARDLFKRREVPEDALASACRRLRRVRVIFELATDHFRLMETMTTRDYVDFRDKLFPASGGQSAQFRELEIVFGLDDEQRIPYVTGGSYLEVLGGADGGDSPSLQRVRARLADRPSLRQAIGDWLYRTPIHGSRPDQDGDEQAVDEFIESYLACHDRAQQESAGHHDGDTSTDEIAERYEQEGDGARSFLRATDVEPPEERRRRRRIRAAALFIEIYRELPLLAWPREILEHVIAVEQAYAVFRQRHARMAERMIGRRVGTGGSSGVDYLDEAAHYRVFRDLWAVRTLLIRRELLPDPHNAEVYGFAAAKTGADG